MMFDLYQPPLSFYRSVIIVVLNRLVFTNEEYNSQIPFGKPRFHIYLPIDHFLYTLVVSQQSFIKPL